LFLREETPEAVAELFSWIGDSIKEAEAAATSTSSG